MCCSFTYFSVNHIIPEELSEKTLKFPYALRYFLDGSRHFPVAKKYLFFYNIFQKGFDFYEPMDSEIIQQYAARSPQTRVSGADLVLPDSSNPFQKVCRDLHQCQ